MQGETVEHTFTPAYDFDQPHDERCHGYYYAAEMLGAPTR